MTISEVKQLVSRIRAEVFGTEFSIIVSPDRKYQNGRLFLQMKYLAPCTKTGERQEWRGRKWYLSSHMTPDEVVKTAYAAFQSAVQHEVMEGFKVDGKILFNPHVNFESLLEITDNEVKREEVAIG